ncbi:MAG TPA: hypothetical protein VF407_19500, partial [Polyangiaceae bacterium]
MRKLVLLAVPIFASIAFACSGGDDDDNSVAPEADSGAEADGNLVADAGPATDAHPIVDAAPVDAGFQVDPDAGKPSSRFKAVSKDKTDAPNGFYEYLPGGYDGSLAAPL